MMVIGERQSYDYPRAKMIIYDMAKTNRKIFDTLFACFSMDYELWQLQPRKKWKNKSQH